MVAPWGANIFVFHVPINWTDDDFNAHFTPCCRQITGAATSSPWNIQSFTILRISWAQAESRMTMKNNLSCYVSCGYGSEIVPGLDRLFLQRFTWIQWPRCMISASGITRACFEDIQCYLMNFSVNIVTWGIQRLWLLFLCHDTSCYNGYQRNEWSCT